MCHPEEREGGMGGREEKVKNRIQRNEEGQNRNKKIEDFKLTLIPFPTSFERAIVNPIFVRMKLRGTSS